MSSWSTSLLLAVLCLLPIQALAQETPEKKDNSKKAKATLTWAGCGITKKAFMHECAKAYEKATGVRIELKGGGATLGIRKATAGSVDMGGSCRICKPDVTTEEKAAQMTLIAWDALVFIAHPKNPVNSITLEQARKIFQGKIRNWKELGGSEVPISLVVRRGKMSGVGYMGRRLLFNNPKTSYYARSLVVRSSGPLEQKIEKSIGAFGLTGISSAKKRKVKQLSINNVAPSKANIASGKYALFRPLFLVTNGKSKPEVQAFLKWILSKDGQAVISKQGTVNLAEGVALNVKYKFWENIDRITNLPKTAKSSGQ
ncbi:MAG: phosphate ABC transporter substrate-binding protein [Planctomycetota bacterium]|nr:phosphate ABC transporter substrate-binding protein [Planctomycetota bacterium]